MRNIIKYSLQNVSFFFVVKIYVWITHDYEWDQASILVYENQIKLKRFIQQTDEPCTLNVFIKYHSLDKIASRALDFNNYIFVSQIKNV